MSKKCLISGCVHMGEFKVEIEQKIYFTKLWAFDFPIFYFHFHFVRFSYVCWRLISSPLLLFMSKRLETKYRNMYTYQTTIQLLLSFNSHSSWNFVKKKMKLSQPRVMGESFERDVVDLSTIILFYRRIPLSIEWISQSICMDSISHWMIEKNVHFKKYVNFCHFVFLTSYFSLSCGLNCVVHYVWLVKDFKQFM